MEYIITITSTMTITAYKLADKEGALLYMVDLFNQGIAFSFEIK